MKCPACQNQLQTKTIDDEPVDVCVEGCGGVWFDNWELEQFDEKQDGAGKELLDINRNPSCNAEVDEDQSCPNCEDVVLIQRFYTPRKQAEIDECPGCGGTWLDLGELQTLRSSFDSDQEEQKAAQEFIENEFRDEFARQKNEFQKDLKKMERFKNLYSWICPSNWISGDQKWGAF